VAGLLQERTGVKKRSRHSGVAASLRLLHVADPSYHCTAAQCLQVASKPVLTDCASRRRQPVASDEAVMPRLRGAEHIRLMTAAARWPPHSELANSQLALPIGGYQCLA
jgi:hypothetical protein